MRPWNANDGTGGFAKLHGGGDLSLVFTGPVSGEETLTAAFTSTDGPEVASSGRPRGKQGGAPAPRFI